MARRSTTKKQEPEVVPFPDILKQRIGQLNRELQQSVVEVMDMLDLHPGTWVADLPNGRFIKQPATQKDRE